MKTKMESLCLTRDWWQRDGENIVKSYTTLGERSTVVSQLDWQTNKTRKRTPPITLDEVIAAVQKLKNGKAPGVDNVPAELIRKMARNLDSVSNYHNTKKVKSKKVQ